MSYLASFRLQKCFAYQVYHKSMQLKKRDEFAKTWNRIYFPLSYSAVLSDSVSKSNWCTSLHLTPKIQCVISFEVIGFWETQNVNLFIGLWCRHLYNSSFIRILSIISLEFTKMFSVYLFIAPFVLSKIAQQRL